MSAQTTPYQSRSGTPFGGASRPTSPGPFAPDSSIVLIGIRGVGKSTLAIMAAKALDFHLVDADQQFQRTTGLSRPAYKSSHGVKAYGLQELKILRQVLEDHATRAVITCSPSSIAGTGRDMLREFSHKHPVILILRDVDSIQRYIRVWEVDAISMLVNKTSPLCRAVSNFEFYNLSESFPDVSGTPTGSKSASSPSLMLKQVERDFIHLICQVTKQPSRHEDHSIRHVQSRVPAESKPHTYALLIPLSQWALASYEFQGVDLMVDAVEVVWDLPGVVDGKNAFDSDTATMMARDFYSVRRTLGLPIIFSIDTSTLSSPDAEDSLNSSIVEDVYFEIMRHALRFGPEYLALDLNKGFDPQRIQMLIASRASTKIIGHFHINSPGSDGWADPSRVEKIIHTQELGCQIVRLSQEAISMADNFSVQQFIRKNSDSNYIPLIAYNTGYLGRFSCCLNPKLTPITHPILQSHPTNHERDWLLTLQECQHALYASFTLDEMYFGIYGSGISLSLSPAMHQAAYRLSAMTHSYKTFDQPSLAHLDKLLKDPSFGGASVTSPFKMEVLERIQYLSPSAKAIRAVNTIIPLRSKHPNALLHRNRRGPTVALYGENTDWIGIRACIRGNLSPINAVGRQTVGLVLGAGGMARATIYAMVQLGVRTIVVYNRTAENAQAMVDQFCNQTILVSDNKPCRIVSTEKGSFSQLPPSESPGSSQSMEICEIFIISSLRDPWPSDRALPTVIVSCIPAKGTGSSLLPNITLHEDWLASPTGGVIIELAYDPLETPLLKQMKGFEARKWIAVDGLKVLPEQGIAQFELFTGRKAPQNLMRTAVHEAYMKQVESGLRASEI